MNMDRSTASAVWIACISIVVYDYVLTLPAEWQIYRGPRGQYFFRTSALLYFLVRYSSVVLLITGSYVFWAGGELSDAECRRLSLVPPAFKCLQAMVVQLIMGWRTYNISRRSTPIFYLLTILYLAVISVQWFTNFYGRSLSRLGGTCAIEMGTTQWMFYLCCIVWDAVTLLLSLVYLFRIQTTSSSMAKLTRTMLVDGLVYFVAMTVVNILNMLIFLKTSQTTIQGSVIIACTAALILSQRILINLNTSENGDNSTNQIRTVMVSASHSAEELAMELSSRMPSAQQEVELSHQSLKLQHRGPVRGILESTPSYFLDSTIHADTASVKDGSSETNQSGPSRERPDRNDDDSLFSFSSTDSGIGTNPALFSRRNEGPLMTTRRY